MHYILIASVWIATGGFIGGYTVSSAEFNNQSACETAKQTLAAQLKDGRKFNLDCVAKGN